MAYVESAVGIGEESQNFGNGDVSRFRRLINPRIMREIWKGKFDSLLVFGHEHLTKWLAFKTSWVSGTGLMMRNDSHLREMRPLHTQLAKEVVLGTLMRSLGSCLSIGELNR